MTRSVLQAVRRVIDTEGRQVAVEQTTTLQWVFDEASGTASLFVSLSRPSISNVTLAYATDDGTAADSPASVSSSTAATELSSRLSSSSSMTISRID